MNENTPADGRHRLLVEGQELLEARRRALRLARKRSSNSPTFSDPGDLPYPGEQDSVNSFQVPVTGDPFTVNSLQATANAQQLLSIIEKLPEHLGWGSAAQTAVFRRATKRQSKNLPSKKENAPLQPPAAAPPGGPGLSPAEDNVFSAVDAVALAPALGLAILRHKQAPTARLWLLLRAIDTNGRGVISRATAQKAFTDQDSPLRFCGQRQLRNLLASGAGIFWQVDKQAIWLRSSARVAGALNVATFRGRDVAVSVSTLTGGIAAVRANLFAAFHSGRVTKPVSRQTMAGKSGVAPRTQRLYDRLSGVKKQANYARGPRVGSQEAEELAWQQGPASFTWREAGRRHKEGNGRFLAWQLPNSYYGPHARLGRGRQKRLNKALADLLNKGTAGNGHSQKDDLSPRFNDLGTRYFADARAASRAFGRLDTAIYWPDLKPGLWHCLWPQKTCTRTNHSKKEAR